MTVKPHTMGDRNNPRSTPGTFGASLKAGLLGGFAISLLLIVQQITPPDILLLQIGLVLPAIGLVWFVTGIGAAMLCDHKIKTSKDGARVGMVAGIIAGTLGGITAMIISAFGLSFQDYGQGFLVQIPDTNLNALVEAGFSEELVVLSGSILTALFACGLGGMVIAGLVGRMGGWLYPKVSR